MNSFEKELYEINVKLCKAVGEYPELYDRNNVDYKKKSATDHCWIKVAQTCNDSIFNCKRRWRQIRDDYTRHFTDSPKRRKMSRKTFYLQSSLKFLLPFMPDSGESTDGNDESLLHEEANGEEQNGKEPKKGKRKEPETVANKNDQKVITIVDDIFEIPTSTVTTAPTSEQQQKESLASHEQNQQTNETPTQTVGLEEPTFYIKQSSKETCTLTISKVTDPTEATISETPQMADTSSVVATDKDVDDVPLASRSRRGGKRSVVDKQLHAVKEIPVARMTRLRNARKSISVSTPTALRREMISPLPKMTPVPKTKQQQIQSNLRQSPMAPPMAPPTTQATHNEIQQMDTSAPAQLEQVSLLKQQMPQNQNETPFAAKQQQQQLQQQTGNNAAKQQQQLQLQTGNNAAKNNRNAKAKQLSNNVDLTSTLDESYAQPRYPISPSIAGMPQSTPKAIIDTSKPNFSMRMKVMPAREDRGVQCGPAQDEFTDDDFLNAIRPQMREMNSRQKLNFKKKVFQSLMEVFDDATDFPNANEVQHFNINTPSGFENTTTQELRLIRELVAIVTASKRTAELQKSVLPHQRLAGTTGRQSPADPLGASSSSKSGSSTVVHQTLDDLGFPRSVIQRVMKINDLNGDASGTGSDKRCILRIMNKSGVSKATVNNPSPGRAGGEGSNQRVGTFVIAPSSSSGPTTGKILADNSSGNTNAFSEGTTIVKTVPRSNASSADILQIQYPHIGRPKKTDGSTCVQAAPAPIRSMSRRYSVCGTTPGITVLGNGAGSGNGNNSGLVAPGSAEFVRLANASVVNANGVQVSLKRNTTVGNPLQLSVNRARYPHIVGSGNVTEVAGGHTRLVGSTVGGKPTPTEFVTPPNPRKANEGNSHAPNRNPLTGAKSTSPYKRQTAQSGRIITQKSSGTTTVAAKSTLPPVIVVANTKTTTPAATANKSNDGSLSRLFSDDEHMQVAGTIAADDFSSVRIKQEDDVLLGM